MRRRGPKRIARALLTAGTGLLIAAFAGCTAAESGARVQPAAEGASADSTWSGTGGLHVAATTSIIGDVVANIGGEDINLTVLLAPGQDPHEYEPTARALAQLRGASVIFVNGFNLEENLLKVLVNGTGGTIVEVSAGVVPRTLADGSDSTAEGATEDVDPHTWMSPPNVKIWVENIQRTLADRDPSHAEEFRRRADAYLVQLDELDRFVRATVQTIPLRQRQLVTDHRVFGYFADEYGLRQIGFVVPSSSTGAETTARDLAGLVELINRENVPAIFVGETAGPRLEQLSRAVASETGRDVRVVPVLTGSLAPDGYPGDTYLDFIRHDVTQIVESLRGR